ncbi:MucB/RseB C-terminal domain-containing protein [Reinekea sp.]|jgi:sigma-E factor negative regulatory protein RseB|uniref:MucB/RseB C-terminal domain-containing protein n=1 Tax=Reinekea sp. TaxID=1970455 RepID=UPI003989B6FA
MSKIVFRLLLVGLVSMQSVQAMEWMWLEKMRLSVQQLTYRGEFLHRRGDETNVYSVIHQYDKQGGTTELLKQLDGFMVEVLRQGELLTCYFPEGSETAADHAVPAAPFTQLTAMDIERISQTYKAMEVGEERVAGFKTKIISLSTGPWGYEHRYWLDKGTHMLLQSELIDADGNVLEQFRFTRLELNAVLKPTELTPTVESPVLVQKSQISHLANKQQSKKVKLNWMPNGFMLSHSATSASAQGWTEKLIYSDGLTSFSVFVDSAGLKMPQSTMAKMGATTALMISRDKLGITVIGEVPEQTALKLAQNVVLVEDF